MLLRINKRAQSTAEYAITIGIVVAVVAGVMSVALKRGMGAKSGQALDYLSKSGTGTTMALDPSVSSAIPASMATGLTESNSVGVYEGDARKTNVTAQESQSAMAKSGAMQSASTSTTDSSSFSYEASGKVQDLASNSTNP